MEGGIHEGINGRRWNNWMDEIGRGRERV